MIPPDYYLGRLRRLPKLCTPRNWEFRRRYCESREISPWLNMNEHGRGDDLSAYLILGHTAMNNGWGTTSARFSEIRFNHMAGGWGFRWGILPRTRSNRCCVRQSRDEQISSINPELLGWGRHSMEIDNCPTIGNLETWGEMALCFQLALRIGEVGKLKDGDLLFETVEGTTCLTMAIRFPKTYQQRRGAKRTLMAAGRGLRPAQTAALRMDRKGWNPLSGNPLFASTISK